MVFHDLVREERYDLWIGDEAWELDYFLHENPELKTRLLRLAERLRRLAADGRRRRTRGVLTADYNAEMLEQIARSRACATARSSSETRRRRPGALRARSAGDPRVDGGPFPFAGYIAGATRQLTPTAPALRAESATPR